MDNKTIVRAIKLLGQLMELHNENAFKAKAFLNAAFKLSKYAEDLTNKSQEQLEKIEGVGKGVAQKIHELVSNHTIADLDKLISTTPSGVIEMLTIKGLGPKKVQIIWKELGIETIGELYYACNENRLVEAKGFGLKTQEEIKKLIEFTLKNNNKFHYATLESIALELKKTILDLTPDSLIEFTGALRRKCEVLDSIEFVMSSKEPKQLHILLKNVKMLLHEESSDGLWRGKIENHLPVNIYICSPKAFYTTLFTTTGSKEHLELLAIKEEQLFNKVFESESSIYEHYNLPYIEPELREGTNELNLIHDGKIRDLIQFENLKGSLHNHSTYSDGIHSLEEMARYCATLGYEYLGICDHSKSAFYANGLQEERVLKQHEEIEKLNKILAPFKIFKGLESDILNDGSLDYTSEVLNLFDFVVASIHSNLKMTEEKATTRLLKAIENPYTTILGHPTGRLLLAREGYPINHKKIIDACAANHVVIEINANPLRLDLDWRWIYYAMEKQVMLSINPDAHRKEGFADMYYGVCVARKGGLTKNMCLNAYSGSEINDYFNNRKKKKFK